MKIRQATKPRGEMSVLDERLMTKWLIWGDSFDLVRLLLNVGRLDGAYFDSFDFVSRYLRKLGAGSEMRSRTVRMSVSHNWSLIFFSFPTVYSSPDHLKTG